MWTALSVAVMLFGAGQPVLAQENPAPAVEFFIGRSGFIDEVWDYFTTIGGGARVYVTPRLSIGPEIAYLTGTSGALEASHLSVAGTLTFEANRDASWPRIVPYLVVGGGYLRQKTVVGRGPGNPGLAPFISSEPTVSAGIGARINLGSRMFVAPEFRLGWEPESRIAVTIGMRTR
jgi:hypothetical protein